MSTINLNQLSLTLASALGPIQTKGDAASASVSSGKRIDRPSADVAGVGIAAKLDAQQARIKGVEVNLQTGVSRMQSTAGQLNTIAKVVTRMNEISVLSANSTQDAGSRALYQTEFTQLQEQLRNTIGGTTAEIGGTSDLNNPSGTFNGTKLFGPGPGETLTIGLQSDETLTLPVLNLRTGALGDLIRQDASGNYTTTLTTSGVDTSVRDALSQTTGALASVAAVQSRLDFSAGVATTASANHEAALSVIRDADVAAGMTAVSRFKMLTDSHTAMLAQARDANAKLYGLLSRN